MDCPIENDISRMLNQEYQQEMRDQARDKAAQNEVNDASFDWGAEAITAAIGEVATDKIVSKMVKHVVNQESIDVLDCFTSEQTEQIKDYIACSGDL